MEKTDWEKLVKAIGEQPSDVDLENYIKIRREMYRTPWDEEANRRFKEMLFGWIEKEVEK